MTIEGWNDSMKTVYIAGPLFDPGERWYLEQIDCAVRDLGFQTYLPHRDGGIKAITGHTTAEIFKADLRGLESVDIVVAVLNGPDVDSGTAWEMGHAFARGIPIIGIHEDIRLKNAAAQINIVVYHSAQYVCGSLAELCAQLVHLRERANTSDISPT
jgi:nucleoside 2-deoxyribosyltransferase